MYFAMHTAYVRNDVLFSSNLIKLILGSFFLVGRQWNAAKGVEDKISSVLEDEKKW